jgi:hypothetical protein
MTRAQILAWQDDPGSGLKPLERPVPTLKRRQFPLEIQWPKPAPPPDDYRLESAAFRYWTAAEALRRAADFWASIVPKSTTWWLGGTLPAVLDAGRDLNASYNRGALWFFHQRVAGSTIYSGESPDILCHELGHAVLDAVKPQLFHTASLEVAAFHEAFGDISAILSALQLRPVRQAVIAETGGRYQSSQVSRLAEQMGAAVRKLRPDAAEGDCLRNAVNSLIYRAPIDLPPWGPASSLSSEPHSLSRVFTAGFFEALCLMVTYRGTTLTQADLLCGSRQAARLLIAAVTGSAVTVRFFAEVATNMVAAARAMDKAYPALLRSAFVRRGILSIERHQTRRPEPRLGLVTLDTGEYGLVDTPIVVQAAGTAQDAHAFLRWLISRGSLEVDDRKFPGLPVHPHTVKSHRLAELEGRLVLERILFDCGFHAAG